MIFELLQSLIQNFSMPLLYMTVMWFGTVGLIVHSAVTVWITKLRATEVLNAVFKLYCVSLMVSYVAAPVCTLIVAGLQNVLYPEMAGLAVTSNLYIWYSLSMIVVLRYLMCTLFVAVPCYTWRIALLFSESFVAIMGYLFLLSARLL